MKKLLFGKTVDKSLLEAGFTIPQEYHEIFQDAVGIHLSRGEKTSINVVIDGSTYTAQFSNVALRQSNRTVFQIRYSSGSPISHKLNDVFSKTANYLDANKGVGENIKIPEEMLERLSIFAIGKGQIMFEYSTTEDFSNKLNNAFNKFLNEYNLAKSESFAAHPFGSFVRKDIPRAIYDTKLVDMDHYLVEGSVGKGNWAAVPWICIFDKTITNTATKGVYIVYLLSKDGKSLYLTFNQGCTEIMNNHSKKETIAIMRERASEIVERIDARGFYSDENIDLGEGLTNLAEMYQRGTIFYKKYDQGSVPSEEILRSDLSKMMDIYREYSGRYTTHKNAWLLTWNPANWVWDDFYDAKKQIEIGEQYISEWTCSNQHAKIGDRVYLTMLGMGSKNGIFASGYVKREGYLTDHYDTEKIAQGHQINKIDVAFDCLLDYKTEEILSQNKLLKLFPEQKWNPQGSGIAIKEKYLEPLEKEWKRITRQSQGGEVELSTKEIIEQIKQYIANKGFAYKDGLVENFYLSLKSKPFVILAGTSGTGKTRLVRLFAEAVGATNANGRYKMVSVRPDWSDSSDLFGHVDLSGRFVPGALIDFVKKAEIDRDNPYFLCLDEMNLARVEYYLSDVISVIETRDMQSDGSITTTPLVSLDSYGSDDSARKKYGEVPLPQNLYIIGTVNMDETTFPFSKKVLDRANTIEFSYVELMPEFSEEESYTPSQTLRNDFLKTEYLLLSQCKASEEKVLEYCVELQRINEILQKANAHVGYRVRDEIVFYMINNDTAQLLSDDDAFDNEIMQKILPRIQGSSFSIKQILCEMFKICAGDYDGYQTDDNDISTKMFKVISKDGTNPKYKKSAEKIAFMVRRYEEDGFTSYWL